MSAQAAEEWFKGFGLEYNGKAAKSPEQIAKAEERAAARRAKRVEEKRIAGMKDDISYQIKKLFHERGVIEYLLPLYDILPDHDKGESNEVWDAKEEAAAKPFDAALEIIRGHIEAIKNDLADLSEAASIPDKST
jgi:hypothetical protein